MNNHHTAILSINLGVIASNYRYLQSFGGITAAAVKANAYGLGATEIAPVLRDQGCQHFFTAWPSEAIALRPVLPQANLYVLHGLNADLETYHQYNLTPVISTAGQLQEWLNHCRKKSSVFPYALHIDTGMNRLGLSQHDIERHRTDISACPPCLLMSHLACADQSDHSMNLEQKQKFDHYRQIIPHQMASLSASSGIFLGPDYIYDMTRPGASIYGLQPQSHKNHPEIQNAITLQAPILQIRKIDSSMTVGYGATYRFSQPGQTATVGLGYADGFLRSAGQLGSLYISDVKCPIVGRVSMDLTCIDVTNVPDQILDQTTYATVIGSQQSVDDLAKTAGTIGYEILTNLGQRYQRRYVR